MKNYKQGIEKLKQGCGKERKEDLIFIVTCDSEDLCQTCQAKLQIWKQALTSEIEFLEKLGGLLIIENNPERYKGLEIVSQRIAELKGALE